jgi:hypothetical protein
MRRLGSLFDGRQTVANAIVQAQLLVVFMHFWQLVGQKPFYLEHKQQLGETADVFDKLLFRRSLCDGGSKGVNAQQLFGQAMHNEKHIVSPVILNAAGEQHAFVTTEEQLASFAQEDAETHEIFAETLFDFSLELVMGTEKQS